MLTKLRRTLYRNDELSRLIPGRVPLGLGMPARRHPPRLSGSVQGRHNQLLPPDQAHSTTILSPTTIRRPAHRHLSSKRHPLLPQRPTRRSPPNQRQRQPHPTIRPHPSLSLLPPSLPH